jgi:hypothetical protein
LPLAGSLGSRKEHGAMGHIELSHTFMAALNAQHWDTVASYLTDDFAYSGGTAGTLDKQGYLAVQQAFFAAAPDYHGTLANVRDEGDTGYGTVTASGTQTQPLALPGLPPISATGKPFAVTFETTVTWRGDQISSMSLQQVGPGLLDQLGIQLPG